MNVDENDRMRQLLRESMGAATQDCTTQRDLWPLMAARLGEQPDLEIPRGSVPWFDWALAGGLVIGIAAYPALIPMLLYYL